MMPTIAGPAWHLGRLYGIPISMHWSLALLLAVQVLQALFQVQFPYSLIWIAVALLVAGSILFHEMAHALIARRRGYHTTSIQLHAFGGFASIAGGGDMRDRDQIAVSAAGPFSNLFLWLVFTGIAHAVGPYGYVGYAAREVGRFNLFIGLFNLLPAYPLDGGSVILSWLRLRAPHSHASWLAFTIGRWVAGPMMLFGLLTNNLLLALVGFLVWQSCTMRLESVGVVGGWPYWKTRIFGPGKLDIDWTKYSRGARVTPPRTPVVRDEPDDRPPTIN